MTFNSDSISLAAASSASAEKADDPQPKLWKKMTTAFGNPRGSALQNLEPKRRFSPVQASAVLDVTHGHVYTVYRYCDVVRGSGWQGYAYLPPPETLEAVMVSPGSAAPFHTGDHLPADPAHK
ncbi:hypothetical protein ABBQ32_014065 [Trebouxia sp. C0010 RCD-2024]